jgi:dUTP pyrophosphatase
VKVGLINLSDREYTIQRGERIAQMVIQQVCRLNLEVVEQLDSTERDAGGFGSTGK